MSLLQDKGVLPNDDTPIKLADIGQWISGAEKMGYTSMLPFIENRKEYRQLTAPGTKPQGWLATLTRIKFFDFLVARYNVIVKFDDAIPAHTEVSFQFDNHGEYPTMTWSECQEALQAVKDDRRPWKKRKNR